MDPEKELANVSLTPNLVVTYEETANIASHLKTRWQVSTDADFEVIVFDMSGDQCMTDLPLPDMVLTNDTICFWRARFIDLNGHAWGWSEVFSFRTLEAPFVDANMNHIPDDQDIDPTLDLEGNGEADLSQHGMFCARLTDQSGEICVYIPDASARVDALCCVDPAAISDMADRPADFPLELVSFRIMVESPGDTVQAVVYFGKPLPKTIGWYQYDRIAGWVDVSGYVAFSPDRTSMTLTLTDGGFGDADKIANGVIVDPSGPGIIRQEPGVDSGGNSSDGGCFIRKLLEN